jgi:hypothetical protein
MVVHKRDIGSQFLNQHSTPITDALSCNTNVTLGDPSHNYYTTLYKSKDTQPEDKAALLRVSGSFGKRIWRRKQQMMTEQAQRDANGNANDGDDEDGEPNDGSDQACHIEGLGRIMTGINSLLSSNVVSSTMAHLLICQEGERFTYSHQFAHLLLSQMEDLLDGKEIHFIFRRNWDKESNETIQWADSSANDYLYRPIDEDVDPEITNGDKIGDMCFYEWTMKFEKKYKTFAEMRKEEEGSAGEDSKKRLKFLCEHPGHKFCYAAKRKHDVIPVISMRGKLCDLELLQIRNPNPGPDVHMLRESFAKQALMLFYPFHTDFGGMKEDGSYWKKFVSVGGTERYDPRKSKEERREVGRLWEYGKKIIEHMQARTTVEKKMRRPPDPLEMCTKTPESTGERKRAQIDKDEEFDIDINAFDTGPGGPEECNDSSILEPLKNEDTRSHKSIMKQANIAEKGMVTPTTNSDTLLVPDDECNGDSSRGRRNNRASGPTHGGGGSSQQTSTEDHSRRYATLMTFIEGSMIGSQNCSGYHNTEEGTTHDEAGAPTASEHNANGEPSRTSNSVPSMHTFARNCGNELDEKQLIAYEILCSTFLLQLLREGGDRSTGLGGFLSASLNSSEDDRATRDKLIEKLKARGAHEQLIMFLTGPAGCGKSTAMEVAQKFCHAFCMAAAVAFDDMTFYFTSTTGSSAALFGGTTIHSAAHLNKSKLTDAMRRVWKYQVRILIIDEISFFKASDMKKLDRNLRRLTGIDKPYGGVSIVFSGDFHQLKPICIEGEVLYSNSAAAEAWENTINCAIFLENTHRFKDDPEYGEILGRLRSGTDTVEDREEINKRVMSSATGNSTPSEDPNACYACATNKERNGVTAGTFRNHLLNTHPTVDSEDEPPNHTLMIEATIRKGEGSSTKKGAKVSQSIHDTITTSLGDNDVRATGFQCKDAKIEPLLRVYPGSHHMCITNEDLDKGRGNGTLCRCVRVKLKKNNRRRWKNWDGRKVWTVSADDVRWVEFEHWPAPPRNAAQRFRLEPKTFSATVNFPVAEGCTLRVGKVSFTQIPVNSNIATTGHKLQGMSKDTLIVNSWNYRCANWIYVVLSRVRKRVGLHLTTPLDLEREFNVPESLIEFERRMRNDKEAPILEQRRLRMQSLG